MNAPALLPADIERATQKLKAALESLQSWVDDAMSLGNLVGRSPDTALDVDALLELTDTVLKAPDLDQSSPTRSVVSH